MEISNRTSFTPPTMRSNVNNHKNTKQHFSDLLKAGIEQNKGISESSNQAVEVTISSANAYNFVRDKVLSELPEGASTEGGNALTEDQISDLKERYDITNMSPKEEFAFYKELLEKGAISLDEFIKAQTAKHAVPAGQSYYVKEGLPAYDANYDTRNIIERLKAVIASEMDGYNSLRATHKEDRQDIKEYAEEHMKLLEYLKQFMRE